MTVSKDGIWTMGGGACTAALYFIGLAFFVQFLANFFYTLPHDRLFSLGIAFALVMMLRPVCRAMARQPGRRSGYSYAPAIVAARAHR